MIPKQSECDCVSVSQNPFGSHMQLLVESVVLAISNRQKTSEHFAARFRSSKTFRILSCLRRATSQTVEITSLNQKCPIKFWKVFATFKIIIPLLEAFVFLANTSKDLVFGILGDSLNFLDHKSKHFAYNNHCKEGGVQMQMVLWSYLCGFMQMFLLLKKSFLRILTWHVGKTKLLFFWPLCQLTLCLR